MSKLAAFYRGNQAKGLVVLVLIVAAITGEFLIFATPHKNSNNLRTSAATNCTPDARLVNPCRPWQGDSSNKYPGVASGLKARTTDYETRTGTQVDFAHEFATAGATLTSDELYYINRPNTYLLLNYKPTSGGWSTADGSSAAVNTNIDNMANSIKAVAPKKIILALWHEPNNDVSGGAAGCPSNFAYVGTTGTPAQYRAMWANVRNRFSALGVTNVEWAIIYMSGTKWDCMQKELWPGNSLVDWVMWDHYYSNAETFASGTSRFYDWLGTNSDAAHDFNNHPWGIGEWGSWQTTQSAVYQLYVDGGKALQAGTYSKIKLWTVWDSIGSNDSRIQYSNASALDQTEQNTFNTNWAQNSAFINPVINPNTDPTPPNISITNPSSGSTISSTVSIAITATDNVKVTRVKTVWDSTNVISDVSNAGSWNTSWNTAAVANGSHTIVATAYDAAGNSKTSSVAYTVSNVTPPPPGPTITSFTTNPATITVGQNTTLTWSSTNTVNCTVNPGGPQNTTNTVWQTLVFSSPGTTNYTLTCKNSAGTTVSKTASVTVNQPTVAPTNVILTADKTSIQIGSSVQLNWSSSGSSSCTLNPGNYLANGTTSSKSLSPTATTTYTVTCSNSAGSTKSSGVKVTVLAVPPPPANPVINSFVADPNSIAYGLTSTLSWQTTNVVSGGCDLAVSPLSSTDGNGSWTTSSLTASASYTLTCKNSAGTTASKSVSVTVANQPPPPPPPASTGGTGGSGGNTVKATTGQTISNAGDNGTVTDGSLLTLDSSNVTDSTKIDQISKVEFYSGDTLIQTVLKAPFALDTTRLKPGTYNLTQRTYYLDGSTSQQSQLVTIKAKTAGAAKHGNRLIIILISVIVLFGLALAGLRYWLSHRIQGGGGYSGDGGGHTDIDLAGIPTVIKPTDPNAGL